MPCARHSLPSSDRTALSREAVARLAAGELVVLPTETVYGLAVLPSHPGAVERARILKGRRQDHVFTAHIAERNWLEPLVDRVRAPIVRLCDRYWPGPLTVVLPDQAGGTVGVRLPAHTFTCGVIAGVGQPLWLTSINRSGEPPLCDPDAIVAAFGDQVSLLVDDGPSPLGSASTVVRLVGPRLEVLREGILSAAEVLQTAAEVVLYVCSGNTCRSPLAAAIARLESANALGTAADDVLAHGFDFVSAGTSAAAGLPASDGSLAVAAELGLDLSSHLSRTVDPELIRRADHIYCMGKSHRLAILAEVPEAAAKTMLLRPDGLDIADPYGGDHRTYRRARDEIRAAVLARRSEWLGR